MYFAELLDVDSERSHIFSEKYVRNDPWFHVCWMEIDSGKTGNHCNEPLIESAFLVDVPFHVSAKLDGPVTAIDGNRPVLIEVPVRCVWLTEHCRDALLDWRAFLGHQISGYVFPSPRDPSAHFQDYKTAWRTAAKKAGLADRRAYDLRSTFASRANVCHATGMTVAHLLGHASTQILATYIRPFDENTRALIEAMDAARKHRNPATDSIN